ncbi:MAG: 4Fe-4S binding protein [Firmicutes bacterium]|nr:4Fe-4S binding protein [Bacillota bacterium]
MNATSVTLVKDRCVGCTTCIKRCPTSAIRVQDGKAYIIQDRCIDCGMCIQVCPHKAKIAVTRKLDEILASPYKLKVALPPPSLYSQFEGNRNINRILTALRRIGFDEVVGVARGAEIITAATKEFIKENPRDDVEGPWISSACPAIVRLIQTRFPSLIDNILPLISPMEVAARIARKHFIEKGYKDEEIGVFFITPCPAKVSEVFSPSMVKKSAVTDTVALNEIFYKIRPFIKTIQGDEIETLQLGGNEGIQWAHIGGESDNLELNDVLAVDGIDNVIEVLDQLENGVIQRVEFIEANACTGGCLGGPLAVANPFSAETRMKKVMRRNEQPYYNEEIRKTSSDVDVMAELELEEMATMGLSSDMQKALRMMKERDALLEKLPGVDCGACGAPSCYEFAGDCVKGLARIEECVILLRDRLKQLDPDLNKAAERLVSEIQKDEE